MSGGDWYPFETQPAPVPDHSRWGNRAWNRGLAALALVTAVVVAWAAVVVVTSGSRSHRASTASPSSASTPSTEATSSTEATTSTSTAANVVGPSGESAATSDSGPMTASLENDVITSTWQTFALAFQQDDLATLSTVATPSVQEVVAGYFLCGCGPWTTFSRQISFSAPPQSAYPRYLMAEIQGQNYNQTPLNKEVVFGQAAPGQPWLVAYLGAYDVAGPLFSTGGGSGNGPPQTLPNPLTSVPSEFQAWAQRLDTTGVGNPLPPHFGSSGISSEVVAGTARNHAYAHANGLTETFSHHVDGVSPVFGTPSGNLMCESMTVTEQVDSKSGDRIVQPSDRSIWTAALPPGVYRTLKTTEEVDTCFLEQPTGTIYEQTNMGGFYQAAGTT